MQSPIRYDDEDLTFDMLDLWDDLGIPKSALPKEIPGETWREFAVAAEAARISVSEPR